MWKQKKSRPRGARSQVSCSKLRCVCVLVRKRGRRREGGKGERPFQTRARKTCFPGRIWPRVHAHPYTQDVPTKTDELVESTTLPKTSPTLITWGQVWPTACNFFSDSQHTHTHTHITPPPLPPPPFYLSHTRTSPSPRPPPLSLFPHCGGGNIIV